MPNQDDQEQIQSLRDRHVGRLLLQAHRAFNARAIGKLQARGYTQLGVSHTAVLPHIDLDGTRITTLADRAGMTKQGMGQIVSDLETQGLITRGADPEDRRAVLVRFTDAGWDYLHAAHAVKKELETEYENALGFEGFEDLRESLARIIALEPESVE